MENIDLNIENYKYQDILNLFHLDKNYGRKELKEAKKMGYDNIVISDKTKNIKTKKMKNIRELIQILF